MASIRGLEASVKERPVSVGVSNKYVLRLVTLSSKLSTKAEAHKIWESGTWQHQVDVRCNIHWLTSRFLIQMKYLFYQIIVRGMWLKVNNKKQVSLWYMHTQKKSLCYSLSCTGCKVFFQAQKKLWVCKWDIILQLTLAGDNEQPLAEGERKNRSK